MGVPWECVVEEGQSWRAPNGAIFRVTKVDRFGSFNANVSLQNERGDHTTFTASTMCRGGSGWTRLPVNSIMSVVLDMSQTLTGLGAGRQLLEA